MENAIEIWPTKCTCGQIIGDVGREYRKLVVSGTNPKDAADFLGLNKFCCLTSLNTPTVYDIKVARTGRIRESVLTPKLPIHTYSLRKDRLAQIGVNLYKEPAPLFQSDSGSENPIDVLRGIQPPTVPTNFNISNLKRGDVVPTGFQLGEDGKPRLIKVGDGYFVPILTYIYRI